jgi:AraC-like DNA-binding protein
MSEFKQQAILFGCMFLFLVGVRLVFVKTSEQRKRFEILIVTSAAGIFLFPVLNEKDIFFNCQLLNHLYLPIYYIFGPSFYLVTLCFLGKYDDIGWKSILLYIPAMGVFIGEIIAYIVSPSLFDQKAIDYFLTGRIHLFDWIIFMGFAFNAFFFIITCYIIVKSISLESIRTEKSIRLFLFEIAFISVGMGITAAGYFMRNKDLATDGILSLLTLAVIAFIFTDYHETAYEEIGDVVERYQKSRLEGVDIKKLELDIEKKMNSEKLYIEDGLTLAGFAENVGIKPYQLSEYLNKNKKMNFSRFINEYRISEACHLLREDETANIIHVAYAVGYNSKANFNLAFKTITGMTPSDFMKKNGKKS